MLTVHAGFLPVDVRRSQLASWHLAQPTAQILHQKDCRIEDVGVKQECKASLPANTAQPVGVLALGAGEGTDLTKDIS